MYVALNHGRPAASAETEERLRAFAEKNLLERSHPAAELSWTSTGKLMVGTRWSGWEVHPARKLEEAV